MIKTVKKAISNIVLLVLYRALRVLSQHDSRVRNEFEALPEGFTVALRINPSEGEIRMAKVNGRLKRIGKRDDYAVLITFKGIDAAFKVLTGQMGVARAYAEHRFTLKGDIGVTMGLVRMIDIAEAYLFPRLMTKMILRSVPYKEKSTLTIYRKVFIGV